MAQHFTWGLIRIRHRTGVLKPAHCQHNTAWACPDILWSLIDKSFRAYPWHRWVLSPLPLRHRGKWRALFERKLVADITTEQGFSMGVVPLFTISETFSALKAALGLTCHTVLLSSLFVSQITAWAYLNHNTKRKIFKVLDFHIPYVFGWKENNESIRHRCIIQQSDCCMVEAPAKVCKPQWK